jgi:hypothetical protein
MRLHNFCRALAALVLVSLLSPILALDGGSPYACSMQPLAVAVQGASPQEPWMASRRCLPLWSERVLARLEQSKANEFNPHLRDDVHIAYLTVLYSVAPGYNTWGCPAHVLASYETLGLHPDVVWSRVLAARKAKLGKLYPAFYDENDLWRGGDVELLSLPPKKGVERERIAAIKAA